MEMTGPMLAWCCSSLLELQFRGKSVDRVNAAEDWRRLEKKVMQSIKKTPKNVACNRVSMLSVHNNWWFLLDRILWACFDPATWGTAFPELYAWWTGVWCPWDGWVSGIRASKVVIACLSESLRMSLKFSCTVFGWRVCEVPMWPTGHAKNAKQKWTRRRAVARNRARMVVQRSRKTAGQFLPQCTWLIGQGS